MKVLNKVVGFVGAGNMASSLISGMIKAGLKPNNIIASSPGKTHLDVLSDKFGIKTSKDNKLVFNESEIIIFAVKPNVLKAVLDQYDKSAPTQQALLISVAAGIKIANIEARRDGLAKRIDELNERRDHLSSRSAEISAQKLELESNSPNATELTEAEANLTLQQDNLLERRDSLHKAETIRIEAEEKSQEVVKALQKAQSTVTELKAEERALEKILASKNIDLFPAIIDALEVTAGFETALGAALGGHRAYAEELRTQHGVGVLSLIHI